MAHSSRMRYFENDVRTASPQKLHLMLIEGAVRNIERAKQAWQEGDDAEGRALEYLIKAQNIVSEILATLDRDTEPELAAKVSAIYLFVYRRLLDAAMEHDPRKLEDAAMVLIEERKTWRQVCEKAPSARESWTQSPHSPPSGPLATLEATEYTETIATGFSIEA